MSVFRLLYGIGRDYPGIAHEHRENRRIDWVKLERYARGEIDMAPVNIHVRDPARRLGVLWVSPSLMAAPPELVDCLTGCGAQLLARPITVNGTPYLTVHCFVTPDVVDWDASRFDLVGPSQIREVREYVWKPEVESYAMFRSPGDVHLWVTGSVPLQVERLGIAGIGLRETGRVANYLGGIAADGLPALPFARGGEGPGDRCGGGTVQRNWRGSPSQWHRDSSQTTTLPDIARAHLPADLANRWLALTRPAIKLVPVERGAAPVARLGGDPRLPADHQWPVWADHGALSYIGELYCDRLTALGAGLDIDLPDTGRLLFFYCDLTLDGSPDVVDSGNPNSVRDGARVIYISDLDETVSVPRATPEGVPHYIEQLLSGRAIQTHPTWDHPAVTQVFDVQEREIISDGAFDTALLEHFHVCGHQVGGYAQAIQGPIEYEAAYAELDGDMASERVGPEADTWTLLLQVESDDDHDMYWADGGSLYWLTRRQGHPLADGDFGAPGRTSFTWQS